MGVTAAVSAHPLARPTRATPFATNGLELVLASTVGATSLSLRIVLDALAAATHHPTASTDLITQLTFTGRLAGPRS
jgi:hypothetical protein